MELVLLESLRIIDFEKEPLGEVICIIVSLQNQLIFVVAKLNCPSEISRLEPGFKLESFIKLTFLQLVVGP
jgi:hypothetical protein